MADIVEDKELQQVISSMQKTYKSLLYKVVKNMSHERIDRIVDDITDTFYSHIDGTSKYPDISSSTKMEENYRNFVTTDFSTSSFNLNSIYDMGDYRIVPGEFVLVQGDTKIGKTAWVQNIVIATKALNVLYLSLEVHEALCYRRFIQIGKGMSKDAISDHYKSGGESLADCIAHIGLITTPCDLRYIKRTVQQHRPQIVVVDTADSLINYGSDNETGAESKIAFGLKSLAQECNTIVIAIHHISKAAAASGVLGLHSGKGSSSFEQQADKLIGMEVLPNSSIRRIRSLAARDESNFEIYVNMDFDTFKAIQVDKPLTIHSNLHFRR